MGSYTVNAGNASHANYLITVNNGALSISQRPITVRPNDTVKAFGETDPAQSYRISSGNLANGDSLTVALSRLVGESAGNYPISANGLPDGNYLITIQDGEFTINQLPVVFRAAVPTWSYSLSQPPASALSQAGINSESDGVAFVDVANAPPSGQRAAGGNANGFMNVFVVRGGINMDRAETQPATAR